MQQLTAIWQLIDQPFVNTFRQSVYINDLTAGLQNADSAYKKLCPVQAEASFNLCMFDTNSPELRQKFERNEHLISQVDPKERVQIQPISSG